MHEAEEKVSARWGQGEGGDAVPDVSSASVKGTGPNGDRALGDLARASRTGVGKEPCEAVEAEAEAEAEAEGGGSGREDDQGRSMRSGTGTPGRAPLWQPLHLGLLLKRQCGCCYCCCCCW